MSTFVDYQTIFLDDDNNTTLATLDRCKVLKGDDVPHVGEVIKFDHTDYVVARVENQYDNYLEYCVQHSLVIHLSRKKGFPMLKRLFRLFKKS